MTGRRARLAEERVPTGRVLSSEIGSDVGFQLRSWRVQRIGWVVGGFVLLLALLGVLGGGALSTTQARGADDLVEVTFERFTRHGHPVQFSIRTDPVLGRAGPVVLWITRDYIDGLDISRVVPEPARVVDGEGRTGWEFESEDVGSEGLDVTFFIEHDEPFVRRGEVAVEGAAPVEIIQLVYP